MGWNFRRSFRLLPGIRLNVGKSGTSVSFGMRGLRTTVGKRGTRTTIGVPGTGLSFTQTSHGASTDIAGQALARDYEAEQRAIEQSPARNAFYERRRKAQLPVASARPTQNPLVCTVCDYERRPYDPGPFNVCPLCKYDLSNTHKTAASTPRNGNRKLRILVVIGSLIAMLVFTAYFLR